MASARYSCSKTMILAKWWGKVMGPMESLKSAIALILGEMPKDEPIKKQALLFPPNFTSFSFWAKSSLERFFPSGVKIQNQVFFGSLERMSSASLSSPAAISAGEGFSGKRCSGNSKI